MAKSDIVLNDDLIDLLGHVEIKPNETDTGGLVTIRPGRGNIRVGGEGSEGDLVVQNNDGDNRIHLDGGGNNWDSPAPVYAATTGTLRLGIKDANGRLLLRDSEGTYRASISDGQLQLRDLEGKDRVSIRGGQAVVPPGDKDDGEPGPEPRSPSPTPRPDSDGDTVDGAVPNLRTVRVQLDGRNASLELGGDGQAGAIDILNSGRDTEGARIQLRVDGDTDTHLDVQAADGSTALSLSSDGTLTVGKDIVVDGKSLGDRLDDLNKRVHDLEGG